MLRAHRLPYAATLVVAFLGCSGGGGDSQPTSPTPPAVTPALTSIAVSGGPSVAVGATLQLTATPRDQNGNAIAATIAWVSGSPSVATVNAAGTVTGVAAGTATITASSGSVSTQTTVTVTAPLVLTSITISGGSTVAAGSTLQLTAAPKDQNGGAIAATIAWTSSAASVATVSAAGLVTGVGAGTAIITASSGSVSAQATITVTVTASPLVLTSIAISGGSTVVAGSTLQLTAAPKDQNGNPFAAALTWTSSATGVATVSASGLVTGVAAGSASIRATSGTVQGTAAITVTALPYPLSASVSTTDFSTFSPSTVDIAASGSVTWTFGSTVHNVTFSAAGSPADVPSTASTSVSRVFSTAGTFGYQCTIHSGMTGVVIVH